MTKGIDELLADTENQITQGKNYIQKEEFPYKGEIYTIFFKPVSDKLLTGLEDTGLEKKDIVRYILSKSLYNPVKKNLVPKKQIEKLCETKGVLAGRMADTIMIESGFDESMLKEKASFPGDKP